jgi:ornithine cyclodeaminase/alanine dehydrogenase-like protein (mu-crystallin family)
MPCHSTKDKLFSLKFVTLFSHNPQRGLPLIQSTVTLTDGVTGTPLAIMDGVSLTAIRTGAVSGLATELLAREDVSTAAIFGAGVQARTQLEAVCCARPIRRARVYCRNGEAGESFAREMSQKLGIEVARASSPSAALQDADVICTATSSATPVFDDRDIRPGMHINAVGSYKPEVVEVPAATVRRSHIVVDHRESALEEAGDLLTPLRAGLIDAACFDAQLGDLVLGRIAGRKSPEEITFFKSVGVAIQDLCAARWAYENAKRLGIGTLLKEAGEK